MVPPITKKAELPSERIERERRQRFDFLKSPMGKTEITGALEKLKSQNPEERIAGAKKLGDLKALKGFEPLLNALKTEKDKTVKLEFLKSVGEIGDYNEGPILDRGIKQLENMIWTEEYDVAREAVWALAKSGNSQLVGDIFESLLNSKNTKPVSDSRLYGDIADAFIKIETHE